MPKLQGAYEVDLWPKTNVYNFHKVYSTSMAQNFTSPNQCIVITQEVVILYEKS